MSPRFKIIVALWFVVQITLPFTAPLQTIDLNDLFGQHPHHQATQLTPESWSVPTTARRPTIFTPLKTATLTAVSALMIGSEPAARWRRPPERIFTTSPRRQHTVLRI